MKVSVLLLTFNEAQNLPRCLDGLTWCDDIVTVDSGSTDGTLEIARERGVRVLERPFDNFANQRNFGLDNANFQTDWVLHLDADEVATPEFKAALDALEPPAELHGYRVPSKTLLYGRWLKRSGMYPTYQVRLGRRDMRFIQVGHGQREALAPDQVGTFSEPYLHHNFSQGLAAWLRKHVRYAEDEAERARTERQRLSGGRLPLGGVVRSLFLAGGTERRRALKQLADGVPPLLRPVLRFGYVYVWRGGLLEGRAGLLYALMLSVYEAMIAIQLMGGKLGERMASHTGGDARP